MNATREKCLVFHLVAILDANSVVLWQIVAGLDGDHVARLEVTVARHRAETDSNCKQSNEYNDLKMQKVFFIGVSSF